MLQVKTRKENCPLILSGELGNSPLSPEIGIE